MSSTDGNDRKLELKPLGKFLQFFAVELMYLEVLLDEFAFLADEGSTRYGSEVYHRLKLLPLILCYATICSETSNVNNAVAIVFIFYTILLSGVIRETDWLFFSTFCPY